ncbi:hypothetical protein DPMN_094202 [Dreissena polymorpha]|uniref:Uncharacterized protein n=1 Tax=Dreissena polymorpha TaxID=45954 RepID=A0A9D4L5P9_DREPO|nr:hypothetical protein DPMN_094202 [Dreissena polymorpha]
MSRTIKVGLPVPKRSLRATSATDEEQQNEKQSRCPDQDPPNIHKSIFKQQHHPLKLTLKRQRRRL